MEDEKNRLIKKEEARLKKIFKNIDKNMLNTVDSLIKNAAFYTISLNELQEIINANGYSDEYQHGESQKGKKQSEEVKTHISFNKNLVSIISKLCDLVPPVERKKSKLEALRDE